MDCLGKTAGFLEDDNENADWRPQKDYRLGKTARFFRDDFLRGWHLNGEDGSEDGSGDGSGDGNCDGEDSSGVGSCDVRTGAGTNEV